MTSLLQTVLPVVLFLSVGFVPLLVLFYTFSGRKLDRTFIVTGISLLVIAMAAFILTPKTDESLKGVGLPTPFPTVQTPPQPVVCTMEARECPDGSWVGRVPPACEFSPCSGK